MTSPSCFNLEINEGITISGKSIITKNKTTVEIIEGTAPYNIMVNGEEMYQTMASKFDVDVKHGDLIEVKTAISCEGVFSKIIQLFDVITLYPNPASNILTIKGVESANSISIFDVLGKEQIRIKNTETNSHFNKVDIHQLQPGLYIIKVFGAKTQNSLKFIKS